MPQLQVDTKTGLLTSVQFVISPNCDERPSNETIDLVVIHGISLPPGKFGSEAIKDLFTNQLDFNAHPYYKQIAGLKVSAHVLITRQGEILQFVPFTMRAWHAGKSQFQGREACNNFSIGIELEGTDDTPYENMQYQQLAHLIRALLKVYPAISQERIVGHSTIAPGRKTDPGPSFDWNHLFSLLNQGS